MDRTIFCVVQRMKITLVSKWQMDRTIVWVVQRMKITLVSKRQMDQTIVCIGRRMKIINNLFYKKLAYKNLLSGLSKE